MEEDTYFENFDKKDYLKKGDKGLTTAHFTSRSHRNFPKIAVLKEFYSIKPKYENEARLLKIFSDLHPNIVQYYYSTQINGHFRIFMEHCECGSIARVIKERKNFEAPWTNSELIKHFKTIADVIKTLHEKGFAHRDMKPDNIFVKTNEILKIGDFGDSNEVKIGGNKNTVTGTPVYMSPDYKKLWNNLKPDKDNKKRTEFPLTKQEEVWSVGKTFYEMAVLEVGLAFPDEENKYLEIVENGMRTRPPELVELLKWMLRKEFTIRPSMDQVLEELEHFEIDTTERSSNYATNPVTEGNPFDIQDIYGSLTQNNPGGKFVPDSDTDKLYFGFEILTHSHEELKQNEESKYYSHSRNIYEVEQSAKNNTLENLENDRILCNECGLETQKDQLIERIKTSLSIGSEPNQVECLNCLSPYPTEIVDSLNNYIS